jgi:hypothetical protein
MHSDSLNNQPAGSPNEPAHQPQRLNRRQEIVDDFGNGEGEGEFLFLSEPEFDEAIIVLEDYGLDNNVRAWLLFDTFSRGVVRAMSKISKEFKGAALYASTHDIRIRDLLLRMGYDQYAQDANDFWLVKQGEQNGL